MFSIFTLYGWKPRWGCHIDQPVKMADVLGKTNIVVVVLEREPQTARLWDDSKKQFIAEIQIKEDIVNVALRQDYNEEYIVILSATQVYVYNFELNLIRHLPTAYNPRGIFALQNHTLVIPSASAVGKIHIEFLKTQHTASRTDGCHINDIQALCMSSNGDMYATASTHGTIIRVFNVFDGKIIRELRRGRESAVIHSLSFHNNGEWLACTSDRGTLHVYGVAPTDLNRNRTSSLVGLKEFLPSYFSSQWSAVSKPIPESSICTFATEVNTVGPIHVHLLVISPKQKMIQSYKIRVSLDHQVQLEDTGQWPMVFDASPGAPTLLPGYSVARTPTPNSDTASSFSSTFSAL